MFAIMHSIQRIVARIASNIAYSRGASTSARTARLGVAQFNILAGNLGLARYFPYVQPAFLAWKTRKHTLLRQILNLDADVICLQELNDFWTFFQPELAKHGYNGIYVKRPSVNESTWSGRTKHDGCAIFFRTKVLTLHETESINYDDVHDRVALMAHFSHNETQQHLIVATTHLYWDSSKIEVQLDELVYLDQALRAFWAARGGNMPLVVTGDFNNGPSSPVLEYVRDAFLEIGGNHAPLLSAFGPDGPQSEPAFTTFNYRRKWTIDFIFHSPSLPLATVGALPSEAEMIADPGPPEWEAENPNSRGIPNALHGSDHVPLVAFFHLPKK